MADISETLSTQVNGNTASVDANTVAVKANSEAIAENIALQESENVTDATDTVSNNAQTASIDANTAAIQANNIALEENIALQEAESATDISDTVGNATHNISEISDGSSTLLGSLLGLAKAHPVISAITVALGGAAIAYKKHLDDVDKSTAEATNSYRSQESSITDLTNQYSDLHQKLIEANGDEEQTKSVKSQLLDLQKQLNEQFGDEYGKINLVTDAYRDQTEAIKAYNAEAAKDYLNKNKEGIDRATEKMTQEHTYAFGADSHMVNADETDVLKQIREVAKKYDIKDVGGQFRFTGNATEAHDAINGFMNDLRDLRSTLKDTSDGLNLTFDDLLSQSSDALGKADSVIDKYKDTYEQGQLAQIASDNGLSNQYNEAIKAVEAYNNAITSSTEENPFNDQNVKDAYDNLNKIKENLLNDSSWDSYRNIIDKTFSEANVSVQDFYNNLIGNKDGVLDVANQLKGLTETDLQSMIDDGNNGDAFDKLSESAKNAGVDVDQLISLLKYLGILKVEPEIDVKQNGDENVANTIKSFDEALAELQAEANNSDSTYKDTYKDIMDLASAGKLTIETLEDAHGKDWFESVGISAEEAVKKVNELAHSADQLSSMKSGISSITSVLGSRKENGSVGADELAGMSEDVKACKKEYDAFAETLGNTSSTSEECQKAANKLATAYVNSNEFLAKLKDSNKEYYESQLKEMGVTNAHSVVTETLKNKQHNLANAQKEQKQIVDSLTNSIKNSKNEEEKQKKQKTLNKIATIDLSNATSEEILQLIGEATEAGLSANELARLYSTKIDFNNLALDTSADIQNLKNYMEWIGATKQELQSLNDMESVSTGTNGAGGMDSAGRKYYKQQTKKATKKATKRYKKKTKVGVNVATPTPTTNSNSSSNSGKDSKTQFDWIQRKLESLQNTIDLTKSKFDLLFNQSRKESNLNKQIKETTKLLESQGKAADRYLQKATKYANKKDKKGKKYLSDTLISKIQNGQIGKKDIQSFGEKTANRINKYKEYYDQFVSLRKAAIDSRKAVRDLNDELLNTRLEANEKKRTYSDAKYKNAFTVESKNALIDEEIATYNNPNTGDNAVYAKRTEAARNEQNSAIKAANKFIDSKKGKKGVSKALRDKIKNLIKQKKQIPESDLNKIAKVNASLYEKLITYNTSFDDIDKALEAQSLAEEQNKTNIREKQKEQHQNFIDDAQSNIDKDKSQSELVNSNYKEQNKYLDDQKNQINTIYAHKIAIAELEQDSTEVAKLRADQEKELRDIEVERFNNIKNQYDNELGLLQQKKDLIDATISANETAGITISEQFYRSELSINEQERQDLQNELQDLTSQLAKITPYTNEWYTANDNLVAVQKSITDNINQNRELNNTIRQLQITLRERYREEIDRFTTETDFLTELFSQDKSFNSDTAEWTNSGLARLGNEEINLESYRQKHLSYSNEISKIDDALANKFMDEDGNWWTVIDGVTKSVEALKKERQDFFDKDQEAAKAWHESQIKIVDIMKERYQSLMDVLNELISKKKEELQSEKDLWDYRRGLAKQVNSISRLEKQLAALSGDTSEAGMARQAKIQSQLNEEKDSLEETEYDHAVSQITDSLDKLSSEYEDLMNHAIDEFDVMLQKALDITNGNLSTIKDSLNKIAEKYGYTPEYADIINNIDKDGNISKTIADALSQINSNIQQDEQQNKDDTAEAEARKEAEAIKAAQDEEEERRLDAEAYAQAELDKKREAAAKAEAYAAEAAQKAAAIATAMAIDAQREKDAVKNNSGKWKSLSSGVTSKVKGFAHGGKFTKEDALSSPSSIRGEDGIAGFRVGERVLTPIQGEQWEKLSNSPLITNPNILTGLEKIAKTPDVSKVTNTQQSNVDVGGVEFNFTLPNVADSNDFLNAIKTDKKVQTALQTVVMNPMLGKSANRVKHI